MSAMLHIIHPYTYKMSGDKLIVGDTPSTKERDQALVQFLRPALGNVRVIKHNDVSQMGVMDCIRDVMFEQDKYLKILMDKRIETIGTTCYGTPIPDVRPEQISAKDWKTWQKFHVSHTALEKMVGWGEYHVVIGGMFENCVATSISYFIKHYGMAGKIACVKDLCVINKPESAKVVEEILVNNGVRMATPKEGLEELLGTPRKV
jgi:hypothetical protein